MCLLFIEICIDQIVTISDKEIICLVLLLFMLKLLRVISLNIQILSFEYCFKLIDMRKKIKVSIFSFKIYRTR